MNVPPRMKFTLPASEIDLVSGQDTRLLSYGGVAGDDEGVGLVIVDKIAPGNL